MVEYVSNKKNKLDFQDYVNCLGSVEPNKGNKMNDINDAAFEPMDKTAPVAGRENADGTVSYAIVEGDTFIDGKLVGEAKVVGHVQIEEPKVD